jgi:hypothetical protein
MGNGQEEKPLFPGLESPAIAHNELAVSARLAAFDVPQRDERHWSAALPAKSFSQTGS